MITIAIVDDKQPNRVSLNEKITYDKHINVAFMAANGEDFLEQMKTSTLKPDVVLMDIDMPIMNGIEAVNIATELYPETRFIMLTVFDDDEKILKTSTILHISWLVALILIVMIILSTTFVIYRIRVQRIKNSFSTKINKEDFKNDENSALELGSSKSQEEKLVKQPGIVILYIKESDEIMNFLSEFRKSLKQHTGCDVSKPLILIVS